METNAWKFFTSQKDILISDASFLALEASIRLVSAKIQLQNTPGGHKRRSGFFIF